MVGVRLEGVREMAAPKSEKSRVAIRSDWADMGWEGGGPMLMLMKRGYKGQGQGQPMISS